ncbi:MAG TPA: diiron oxygenase [Thioalkalivibrio sp.]|nr:diiron oxygenase [Thioalkalivibrio sp.]
MTQPSSELLEQLSRNSTPYLDPLGRVDWEALSLEDFWLPEEALSLYGLDAYGDLPVERRQALSQYEFLNFIEGALWLESIFMERISRSMGRVGSDLSRATYRLHELREEAGHSLMFLELMRRSRLPMPRTRFRRFNLANLLGRHAPYESSAFWMAVLIGEEVPDRMNRLIRKHRDKISPTIYDMITVHVIDEARHIAHARETLGGTVDQLSPLQRTLFRPVMNTVFRQFVHAFYDPHPRIYELAGRSDGRRWARLARQNPQRTEFVDQCVASALRVLEEHGLKLRWR